MERTYRFGPFELDRASFQLRCAGERVALERRGFDLLLYLIQHRDRVVGSEELLEHVWHGTTVTQASLVRGIRVVRVALGDSAEPSRWVATVRGRGYRFVGTLEGEPGPDSRLPASKPRDPFVGRCAELTHLEHMLDDACRGRGGVCLLAGGPGAGKTRLTEQVRERAEARGMSVLSAWCQDGEGAPSYWPWIQLLRNHAGRETSERLAADLGPHAEVVASIVPDLGERLSTPSGRGELAGDDARFRFFDGVSRIFLAAARRRPLLLVLDDLHSADAPSLRLCEFLAREVADAPLLLVAAHRNAAVDLPDLAREVLASVGRHRHGVRLELSGLASEDVAALARAADLELDADQVKRIHQRTGGNPLFVRELVRHAALSGGDVSHELLPDAVRDLLAVRFARLSAAPRALLEAASIVGSEWSEDLVRAVVEIESDASLRALEAALASGVIRRCPPVIGRFAFAHALFREALYTELHGDARRHLHARATAWLATERGAVDPAEVAYHAYHSADLDGGSAALRWAQRAAAHAMSRLAYEDAADHLTRGLELVDRFGAERPDELRCALLVGLGEARIASGDRPRATRAFLDAARLARTLRSGPMLARIALGLSPGLVSLEINRDNASLIALLSDALELCTENLELSSRLLARLAIARLWCAPGHENAAIAERAVKLACESRSAPAEAFARTARFFVRWTPANLEERMRELPELLSCVTRGDDGELAVQSRVARFATLLESGKLHAARAEMDALDKLADELRQPQALWSRLQLRAGLAHLHGDFKASARLRGEFARAAENVGDLNAVHSAAVFDIMLAWEEGRDRDALLFVENALPLHSDWENVHVHALARCGEHEAARRLLTELCEDARLPFNLDWLALKVNHVDACDLLGDGALAAVLYGQLLPYRGRTVLIGYGWGSWGALDRSLGQLASQLGRWHQAETSFEAALDLNRKLGARPFVARTQYDYARMLRARGEPTDRRRSDERIADALCDARALGMTWLTSQLEALAQS